MTKSVLIIGAGHNSLVCASYLAKAGHQVTVFEASDRIGGAAITREFHPGFRVSAGAHLLYMLDAGIRKDLDLESHGLQLAKADLETVALDPDGKHLRFRGPEVHGVSAEDQAAMQEYHRLMTRFAGVMGGLHSRVPPRMGTLERGDLFSLARLGWDIRRLGRDDMREFLRIAGINIYDVLQERFDSELLKGAMSLDGTLGTFLGARSNNGVFCALHRRSQGGRYDLPAGGMGTVSDSIAAAARTAGAEVHTSRPVRSLLMDFDRVVGVELDSGEKIEADCVVSGADPKTTFFKLLGTTNLEAGFAWRVRNIRTKGNAAKLHLALDGAPEFAGLDGEQATHRLVVAPSMQYVEQAFNRAKYGQHSERPVMEITVPSLSDDSLAPAGQHVLSAVVQWAPYELQGGWDQGRDGLLAASLDTLEAYAPGIREQVLHAELLAPPDIEAEFGMTGGHWHHAELCLDQAMMMRPVPGAAQYATPVAGLWLCGAGSHPGGGVMGCAGRNAAKAILKSEGQGQ